MHKGHYHHKYHRHYHHKKHGHHHQDSHAAVDHICNLHVEYDENKSKRAAQIQKF